MLYEVITESYRLWHIPQREDVSASTTNRWDRPSFSPCFRASMWGLWQVVQVIFPFMSLRNGSGISIFGSTIVITSYSIHYTKLYDAD